MKTILVVDDDRNLRRLYKAELEAEGFKIRLAENGSDALGEVSEEIPDLIVMDISSKRSMLLTTENLKNWRSHRCHA